MIKTIIRKIDPNNIDLSIIKEAAKIINAGGTVVFPTETVYGIGADALNEEAVDKIFKAKGRPQDNPLIVHIADINKLDELVDNIPVKAKKLCEKFWPGPVTILFNKKIIIPDKITAGLKTVAIRMPQNKIALSLIKESGKPIAAPSANLSGKPSTTKASHVIDDLMGKVDMIIDGGNSDIGVESTVIDVMSAPPMILRPGGLTEERILEVFESVTYDPALKSMNNKIVPKCPGQKYRHYSPNADLEIFRGELNDIVKNIKSKCDYYISKGKKVGILGTDQTKHLYQKGIIINAGDRTNLMTISSNIFSALRKFDQMGVDIILVEEVKEHGVGKAIMNRLNKAETKSKGTGDFDFENEKQVQEACLVSDKLDKRNHPQKIKILFVCMGNTCRSIMAEGLFYDMIEKNKDRFGDINIEVKSAGLSAVGGGFPNKYAVKFLNEEGIDSNDYRSTMLNRDMINEFDLILTMTSYIKSSIIVAVPSASKKVFTLKEYDVDDQNNSKNMDISDPYGMSYEVYKSCGKEIKTHLEKLVEKLIINNNER